MLLNVRLVLLTTLSWPVLTDLYCYTRRSTWQSNPHPHLLPQHFRPLSWHQTILYLAESPEVESLGSDDDRGKLHHPTRDAFTALTYRIDRGWILGALGVLADNGGRGESETGLQVCALIL